ncbi:hypothetical protein PPACK8108_LOCUS161 [Phakopsora pachyrhizi]|uniref:Uncharacterized protein n=1 Tax=Phakopsora pachyrhizi TaxID=170000 RepID=A0AAV0AD07_PHAPC|nr:hypothetical protein PPACK8108_LOCUS161 [Phakopsora pachyrhizi]
MPQQIAPNKIASATGLPSHTGQDVLQELFQNIVTSNPGKSTSDIEYLFKIDLKNIPPPLFHSSKDILSPPGGDPDSAVVKRGCEMAIRQRGFPRITFDWNIKSLSSSPWNNSQSIILVEHYIGWVRSQKEISEVEISFLPKLLERWVINKGKEIESSRGLSEEALTADKKIKLQKAHSAQIFTSEFPRFIILFGYSGTTSEVEDGDDINQFPWTLKPLWRIPKRLTPLSIYTTAVDQEILKVMEYKGVPVGLQSDVYAGEFVAGLSEIQNMELKKQPSCDLARFKAKLQQKLGLGGSNPGGGGSNTPQSARPSGNRPPSDQPIIQQNQSSRMVLDK